MAEPTNHGGDAPLTDQLGAVLRAIRRRADLSQRQLARRAGVPPSTVARLEAERGADPRLRTLEKVLMAAGVHLAVVTGRNGLRSAGGAVEIVPALPDDGPRDGGARRYAPHLDVRPVRSEADWWGAWWGYRIPRSRWPMTPPEHTFDLNRARRNRRRYGYADLTEFYDDIDVDPHEDRRRPDPTS